MCLSEVPLARFLDDPLIPYEDAEITRLIFDSHDAKQIILAGVEDNGGTIPSRLTRLQSTRSV